MKPMRPVEPMPSMQAQKWWWDESLGQPDAYGSQNGFCYAYFAKDCRLLVRRHDDVSAYDTGAHEIYGATQSSDEEDPKFTSSHGLLVLTDLRRVSG